MWATGYFCRTVGTVTKEMNSRLVYAEQQEMEQGIEHGMEIVAKNMLRKNMDIAIITEVTGLTKTQVEELNVA